jgi:hypothetical protein
MYTSVRSRVAEGIALRVVLAAAVQTSATANLGGATAIATLLPALWTWSQQPTALRFGRPAVPEVLRCALVVMAVGVFASGVRDLYAAARLPHGDWPWSAGREVRKP